MYICVYISIFTVYICKIPILYRMVCFEKDSV